MGESSVIGTGKTYNCGKGPPTRVEARSRETEPLLNGNLAGKGRQGAGVDTGPLWAPDVRSASTSLAKCNYKPKLKGALVSQSLGVILPGHRTEQKDRLDLEKQIEMDQHTQLLN